MGYQDLVVLDAADEPVLYVLPVQTLPTRSFEVMEVGPLGKTAFHQITSANSVPLGQSDAFLSQVPHDGAFILGGRASHPQMAIRAYHFAGLVFNSFGAFVITSLIKVFSSRADVDVLTGIIRKVGFGKFSPCSCACCPSAGPCGCESRGSAIGASLRPSHTGCRQ